MNFFSRFSCKTSGWQIALICFLLIGSVFNHPAKAIVCVSGTYCLATTPNQMYINNLGVSVLGIGSIDGMPTNNITLINYGAITTAVGSDGMFAQGSNVTILNTGTVDRGNQYFGIYVGGADSQVTNTGAITTTDEYGIAARGASVNVVIVNSGTITTTAGGEGIYTDQSNASITNSGLIRVLGSVDHALVSAGSAATIVNSGTITTVASLIRGVVVSGSNTSVTNSGLVETSGTSAYGIYSATSGTTIDITSAGRIVTGGSSAHGIQITSGSAAITMQGTTTLNGPSAYGINNVAGIVTLSNAQGAGNVAGALTYKGVLPTTYNIIILGAGTYGRLSGSGGVAGTMSFGISSLSAGSSIVSSTVYTSVLSGITNSQLGLTGAVSSLSGVSNSYSYTLSETATGSGIWNLLVTGYSGGSGGTGGDSVSTISAGASVTSSLLGSGTVFNGGTLIMLPSGTSSSIVLGSSGTTVMTPSSSHSTLSGVISGFGGLTITSGTGTDLDGTVFLTGANTYSGGTTISSGTLQINGPSALGTGNVYVNRGGMLMGTGTIAGGITVAGTLKPGNSPGYLQVGGTVTMQSTSTYVQDIAGVLQSSNSSPVGASGYYAYLNSTGGQFVINAGATLTPRLSNLFSPTESGYGSAIYVPALGDRFRIVTAAGGIAGRFSTVTQPAELTAGTQLLPFYNMAGSNSVDLAVIPTSYNTTIASLSGNQNAQSVATALDRIVTASQAGTSTAAQDELLYAGANKTAANLAGYTQSLAGEVYSAAVAVIAQTTQRVQQAVQARLGDNMGIGLPQTMAGATGNTTAMGSTNAVLAGGIPTATVGSNPSVNPAVDAASFSNGNVWGELAYQKGNRSNDGNSGGWSSNLYQLVFGSDFYPESGMKLGGGFALSSTTLTPVYGSATVQQGSLFAYGKMPIEEYVIDAMASVGLSTSDISRSDVSGLASSFRNKNVSGNDAMLSLGVSRPTDLQDIRITPFARVTWQIVTQSGVNEDSSGAALTVNRYTGQGARGVLGIAASSKANNPLTKDFTYRAYVGLGADSSGLLNPTLSASLSGLNTSIATPKAGTAFVQAGLYGTAKFADNAYAYAGISGEARTGQTLGTVSLGVRVQF